MKKNFRVISIVALFFPCFLSCNGNVTTYQYEDDEGTGVFVTTLDNSRQKEATFIRTNPTSISIKYNTSDYFRENRKNTIRLKVETDGDDWDVTGPTFCRIRKLSDCVEIVPGESMDNEKIIGRVSGEINIGSGRIVKKVPISITGLCPKCKGSKYYNCPVCTREDVYLPNCSKCNGTTIVDCEKCNGSGLY